MVLPQASMSSSLPKSIAPMIHRSCWLSFATVPFSIYSLAASVRYLRAAFVIVKGDWSTLPCANVATLLEYSHRTISIEAFFDPIGKLPQQEQERDKYNDQ